MNKLVEGPIYHVDIASSYPFILCAYKFPYSKWQYKGRVLPESEKFRSFAYICKIKFYNIEVRTWNTYISSSKCIDGLKMIKDNGRLLKADEVTLYLTEFDYDIVTHTYKWDRVESLGCWKCRKQYLPKIYIDFVLEQYENKTRLKGVDPVKYAISKTYINSLYGMAVSSIVNADVLYDPDEGWSIDELTSDIVNAKFEKMRRWYDRTYFLHYAAGCWVTSAARHRLWQCIMRIDKDLVYTDTDSLFYLNDHDWEWFNNDASERLNDMCIFRDIDFERTRPLDKSGVPHPLGVLEFEETCNRFKSLGAKKYIEERDDKLYMTISGVNKSAVGCLNSIDDFKDDFEFDKDSEFVHKSELVYIDDMPPVTFPDGYHSDLRHGINMRPTGYKLSVPTVYDSMQKIIEGVLNPSDQMIIRKRGLIYDT